MTDSFDPQNDFDAFYYAMGCGSSYDRHGHWLGFFQGMADQIIADLHPKNVLDAGCAKGFLVEGLRNRGVEAWGIDISEYAIQEVFDPIKPYCKVGSITDPFPQKYDLIVTIEVVEHMAAEMGKKAIANMCAHTDRVLFSSTPFDYKETTHFNVQPPEYWAREFARHGFFRDVDFDASFITSWAVCFKKVDLPLHQLTYDYERRFWLLWKENTDLRKLSNELRKQGRAFFSQTQSAKIRLESLISQMEQNKTHWNNKDNDLYQEFINQINLYLITLKNLNEELNFQSVQIKSEMTESSDQPENLLASINRLETNLAETIREREFEKKRADELQQRWEALERTRTWKVLSSFYKIRKPKS